jgi:hypothetical protein
MMMKLLTTNAKLDKQIDGQDWETAGLVFAPADQSGHNVCGASTAGCRRACVTWFAGRTVTSVYRQAAIRRTELFKTDPDRFFKILWNDIDLLKSRAIRNRRQPAMRWNISSDEDFLEEISRSELRSWDYTKVFKRAVGDIPDNYDLTFSRSEKTSDRQINKVLSIGRNVAVCFDVNYQPAQKKIGRLPAEWHGIPVIDGDVHDLRFADPKEVIVGLRLKGSLASKDHARKTGFAVPVDVGSKRSDLDQAWIDRGMVAV